jgi:hypothetical protein
VLGRHANEIKYCWERGGAQPLELEADTREQVQVRNVVSGTGAVSNSAVTSSTLDDAKAERCMAQAARRWTFPPPDGGGATIIDATFRLESRP